LRWHESVASVSSDGDTEHKLDINKIEAIFTPIQQLWSLHPRVIWRESKASGSWKIAP